MTRAVITHHPDRDSRTQRPAVDMSAVVGGTVLPDPVLTASGCAAAGRELAPFMDLAAIGAVVTKS